MVGSKNLHPDCLESLRPRGHVIHAAGVAACRIYSTIGRGPAQASGACGYALASWLEVLREQAIDPLGRRAFFERATWRELHRVSPDLLSRFFVRIHVDHPAKDR